MIADLPLWMIGAFVLIFGLVIGSFLNVVIYRLPRGESLAFPSSHCTKCSTPIKPYDNIPVVGYLLLGGRCRSCKVHISAVYPIVELATGLLYLLFFWKISQQFASTGQQFWLNLLANLVFVSLIIPLVFIDYEHQILPNAINYPGAIVMTVLRALAPDAWVNSTTRALFGLASWPDWSVALLGSLLGAIVGGGSLWLVREAYFRLRKVEGMGLGDVKMMVMVGAFLGWQLTLLTVFIGSLLGSLIGLTLIRLRGGGMKTALPFGVFLGPASLIALLIGQELIRWYTGFYR